MSKKIKLLQDGRDKTLPKVAKIETQLAEGKNCYWIPEDEVPLGILQVSTDGVYNAASDPNGPFYGYSEVRVSGVGTREMGQLAEITITKNGTYAANVDQSGPFYGYSKVIVNVPTSGEGGDPTSRPTISGQGDDGNDEVVGTDDDGNLVYEKVPSSIRVITTPDNLEYEDGQSILFDGLYVKAYLKDGTEWGVVPNTDLIKPVRVAEFDQAEGYIPSSVVVNDPSLFNGSFGFANVGQVMIGRNSSSPIAGDYLEGGKIGFVYYSRGNNGYSVGIASDEPFTSIKYEIWGDDGIHRNETSGAATAFTYNDKTIYYSGRTREGTVRSANVPINDGSILKISGNVMNRIAWACIYGDTTVIPGGSTQTVPLQWKRPGDKKVLETSFTITVRSSGDNNTSGSTTPGGTNIDVPQ